MKVLLIKTSSMGDVIHALPAVTEAVQRVKGMELAWIVEERLADLVRMHPSVARVIPVSIRRWRQSWWRYREEIRAFLAELRDTEYDLVIDSQGLIKSSLLTVPARGEVHGYAGGSTKEPLATAFYQHNHDISKEQHAVIRQKQLIAASLGYESDPEVVYGLKQAVATEKNLLLIHGTTWSSKEWPLRYWQVLAGLMVEDGYRVLLPAGSEAEKLTAEAIIGDRPGEVLFGRSLFELTERISRSAGAVSVDSGLGHLAVALGLPVVGLYGATDPVLTGLIGPGASLIVSDHLSCIPCKKRKCSFLIEEYSSNIYPPCFSQTSPESVWQALQLQIGSMDTRPG